jgi:O-antigen ligase
MEKLTSHAISVALFVSASAVLWNGNVANGAYFLLLLTCIVLAFRLPKIQQSDGYTTFLFLAPLVAVLIGQSLRGQLNASEFDAPARLLGALFIYLCVSRAMLSLRKVFYTLAIGATLGLVLVTFFIDPKWTSFYGGRFATLKSAPNDLGGYSGLLLVIAVTGLLSHLTDKWRRGPSLASILMLVGLVIGTIAGAYVLLGTQSRGPWLVVAVSILLLFAWHFLRHPKRTSLIASALIALLAAGTQTTWFQTHQERVWSTIGEPLNWLKQGQRETSGGARLSMLPASIELFSKAPISGHGDFGYSPHARKPEFAQKYGGEVSNQLGGQGGPHNEIAARSLQSGIWGLIATVFLLVYPVYRFGRQTLQAEDEDQRDLSFMGFVIFSYIFLLSFVLEPYSLKHTATFNALLLAVMLGATRIDQAAIAAPEKSNA